MEAEELRRRILAIENIASPSASLDRILELAADCESDIGDLRAAIETDPAVTSRVLKLSNSAYFAVPGGVETVDRAVLVIGYKNVLSLATCAAMAPVFAGDDPNLDRTTLWRHSCAVGEAARVVCEHSGADASVAYVAGLLHDLGMAVLSEALGEEYGRIIADCAERAGELHEAERSALGVDHGWAASTLFQSWTVPERLLEAAATHHAPERDHSGFGAVVAVADHLARQAGYEGPCEPGVRGAPAAAWLDAAGIKTADLDALAEALEERRGVIELGASSSSS